MLGDQTFLEKNNIDGKTKVYMIVIKTRDVHSSKKRYF